MTTSDEYFSLMTEQLIYVLGFNLIIMPFLALAVVVAFVNRRFGYQIASWQLRQLKKRAIYEGIADSRIEKEAAREVFDELKKSRRE